MSGFGGFSIKKQKKREELVDNSDNEDDNSNQQQDSTKTVADNLKRTRQYMNNKIEQANNINSQKTKEFQELHDESVFAYDDVYDEMKASRGGKSGMGNDKTQQKPKYMEQLLRAAKERELQHEKAKENTIRREIEHENKSLGEATEVFLTSGYKRKLEERKAWDKEQERIATEEEKNDVRKKNDLTGFYSGLLENLTTTDSERAVAEATLPPPKSDSTKKSEPCFEKDIPESQPTKPDANNTSTEAASKENTKVLAAPQSTMTPELLQAAKRRALERFEQRKETR